MCSGNRSIFQFDAHKAVHPVSLLIAPSLPAVRPPSSHWTSWDWMGAASRAAYIPHTARHAPAAATGAAFSAHGRHGIRSLPCRVVVRAVLPQRVMAKQASSAMVARDCSCTGDGGDVPAEPRVAAPDIYIVLAGLGLGNPRDLKLYANSLEEKLNETDSMNRGVWTRKQVEDMVVAANIRGLDPACFNDLADWLQSRLNIKDDDDSSSDISTSTINTSTESPLTPPSGYAECPDWFPSMPFQAKVEDDTSPQGSHRGSVEDNRPASNTSRRRPPPAGPSQHSPRPSTSSSDASFTTAAHTRRNPFLPNSNAPTPNLPTPPSSTAGSPKLRPTVHFSERAPPKLHHRTPSRSDTTSRASAGPELSVVDLQWGRLFMGDGEPTTRLLQVLRGLANYIAKNNESPKSLVVTPDKLHAFYKRFRLDKEQYHLQRIFNSDSRKSLKNLELLYQDLKCEYHLVQGNSLGDRPYIPALTPDGFAAWMANFIRACPDLEARRLDHVMAALPIDAAGSTPDGKPERLPKQLSRHLFPPRPLKGTEKRVDNALMEWAEGMDPSDSRPSSWSSVFCDAICRSLSPGSRDRGRREEGGRRYTNAERDTYVEVPAGHSSRSRHRSSRSYHQTRDRDEQSTRYPAKTYVEEASRRTRDASPRRHNRHRERSPRPTKHRDPEPREARRRGPAAQTTPPPSRECSPRTASKRANNYAFFQGRDPGKTYEELDFLRETSAARRTDRGARYGD
ncbi:Uncharacterized protein TPAR_06855 [Tolypocladium paradoxum]|uniref:DUF7514 domain-containing protein n=1 Tax=Tolypocladium paradoxum TaxID=94208 RepID=A0A2S4KRW7_9HYPO|nr:Uncharacterized protein TPAR_06855 [Tolypocladium paradoxum]